MREVHTEYWESTAQKIHTRSSNTLTVRVSFSFTNKQWEQMTAFKKNNNNTDKINEWQADRSVHVGTRWVVTVQVGEWWACVWCGCGWLGEAMVIIPNEWEVRMVCGVERLYYTFIYP